MGIDGIWGHLPVSAVQPGNQLSTDYSITPYHEFSIPFKARAVSLGFGPGVFVRRRGLPTEVANTVIPPSHSSGGEQMSIEQDIAAVPATSRRMYA